MSAPPSQHQEPVVTQDQPPWGDQPAVDSAPPPPPTSPYASAPDAAPQYAGPPPPAPQYAAPQYAGVQYAGPQQDGPLGQVRSTGVCILLMVVTLGIYSWYWYYKTHDEMKRHTAQGTDPAIALVLGIFLSFVMVFLTPNDVDAMYRRKQMDPPVSAVTGLWALLLGWFFFVGLLVWFVKVNGALNSYWRSQGAQG